MDTKTLKIITTCKDQSIKDNGKVSKETLEAIIAQLPREEWEDIPGNTLVKREMFRGYVGSENGNGLKWKAAKIFMYCYWDKGKCKGCSKKLPFKGFHLHHINGIKDYFTFDPNNFQCMHKLCHKNEHDENIESMLDDDNIKTSNENKKDKTMSADKFLIVVQDIKKLNSRNFSFNKLKPSYMVEVDRRFLSTSLCILTNCGFLIRLKKKNSYQLTNEFDNLCNNDLAIKELYTCFKHKCLTPGDCKTLKLEDGSGQVAFADRINHPSFNDYCKIFGIEINDLLNNSNEFRKTKLNNKRKNEDKCKKNIISYIETKGLASLDDIKQNFGKNSKRSTINRKSLSVIKEIQCINGMYQLNASPVAPSPVAPSPVAPSPVAPSPVAPSKVIADINDMAEKLADNMEEQVKVLAVKKLIQRLGFK